MVDVDQGGKDKSRHQQRSALKTAIWTYLALCCAGGLIVGIAIIIIWSDVYFGPVSKTTYCLPITQSDGTLRYDLTCAKDFGHLALTILYGPILVVFWGGIVGLLLLGLVTVWRKRLGADRELGNYVQGTEIDSTASKMRAAAAYMIAITALTLFSEQHTFQFFDSWLDIFQNLSWPLLMAPVPIFVLAVAWRRRGFR
ncbi:MAG: hypothetical protein MJE12_02890 [Alphaproteobacteria bacterium]|nr:hypothetical protein [Alphaproteobacteria bacterium]